MGPEGFEFGVDGGGLGWDDGVEGFQGLASLRQSGTAEGEEGSAGFVGGVVEHGGIVSGDGVADGCDQLGYLGHGIVEDLVVNLSSEVDEGCELFGVYQRGSRGGA